MEEIIKKLINDLSKIKNYNGDLSDVGNEIGIIIGDFIDIDKNGYNKEDFIHGIKHGISLKDGTH